MVQITFVVIISRVHVLELSSSDCSGSNFSFGWQCRWINQFEVENFGSLNKLVSDEVVYFNLE